MDFGLVVVVGFQSEIDHNVRSSTVKVMLIFCRNLVVAFQNFDLDTFFAREPTGGGTNMR